jgi:hypothetical protein
MQTGFFGFGNRDVDCFGSDELQVRRVVSK